jgi:hypothetical protein
MASKTEETTASVTGDLEKAPPAAVNDDEDDEFPPFAKVVLIMTALYLAMFLVALVRLSGMESRTHQLTSVGSNNFGYCDPKNH